MPVLRNALSQYLAKPEDATPYQLVGSRQP